MAFFACNQGLTRIKRREVIKRTSGTNGGVCVLFSKDSQSMGLNQGCHWSSWNPSPCGLQQSLFEGSLSRSFEWKYEHMKWIRKLAHPFDNLHSRSTAFSICIVRPFYWILRNAVCEVIVGPPFEWTAAENKFISTDA